MSGFAKWLECLLVTHESGNNPPDILNFPAIFFLTFGFHTFRINHVDMLQSVSIPIIINLLLPKGQVA